MTFRRWLPLAVAAPLLVTGCDRFQEAMTAHTDVVARAAGKELKVEEAARFLASDPNIPADPQVVRALAEFWTDYTLLATAIAEDSSLKAVDLEAFLQPAREQMLVFRLRDQVIRADTTFTPQEVQQRWATDGPGAEIHARHILLRVPSEASQAQRDSLRRFADELRQRAAGGADFAALARQFSQDPGSAQQGGDLGFFGRGRMVEPFEQAAFALQDGQVSPVVETPFGYHIIKVEGRRQQALGDQQAAFTQYLKQRAVQDAETRFLDSLASAANVQTAEGAVGVVKEIAANADSRLQGRAGRRPLATYRGGELTAGEFSQFVRTQPEQMRQAFSSATDEQIQDVIKQMTRKELLLAEAERRNLKLTPTQEDSLRTEARQAIRQLTQMTGLTRLAGLKGEQAERAIEEQVRTLLTGAISGQTQLVPLGPLGAALREAYGAEINASTFPKVVAELQKTRPAQAPQTPPGAMPPGAMPPGAAPQGMPPQGMPPQGMPPMPPAGAGEPPQPQPQPQAPAAPQPPQP